MSRAPAPYPCLDTWTRIALVHAPWMVGGDPAAMRWSWLNALGWIGRGWRRV